MSLLDDAQEAWEDRDGHPDEMLPAIHRESFIAGYLAACKAVSERVEEHSPTYHEPFMDKEVPRNYMTGRTRVWIDDSYLAELNQAAGKDPQEHM